MEKITNSHILRITGSAELESALKLGDDYTFIVIGNVVKDETKDNQDGTVDKVYKLKIITAHEQGLHNS